MSPRSSLLRFWLVQVCTTSLLLSTLTIQAFPPAWWTSGTDPVVLNPEGNNKTVANVGQAKWMAQCAFDSLSAKLGAEDPVVLSIGAELFKATENDTSGVFFPERPVAPDATWLAAQHSPLQIRQLKALAAPFYKHLSSYNRGWMLDQFSQNGLQEEGIDYYEDSDGTLYPWNPADNQSSAKNHAVAAIGQLKLVFSLRFEEIPDPRDKDTDGDGLSDLDEAIYGTNPNDPDSDNDGLPDGWEVKHGLDPNDDTGDNGANGDPDHDGNTNTYAWQHGTWANGDPALVDNDHDGLPDLLDAHPGTNLIKWKKSPKAGYMMMLVDAPNGDNGIQGIMDLNENSEILFTRSIWSPKTKTFQDIPDTESYGVAKLPGPPNPNNQEFKVSYYDWARFNTTQRVGLGAIEFTDGPQAGLPPLESMGYQSGTSNPEAVASQNDSLWGTYQSGFMRALGIASDSRMASAFYYSVEVADGPDEDSNPDHEDHTDIAVFDSEGSLVDIVAPANGFRVGIRSDVSPDGLIAVSLNPATTGAQARVGLFKMGQGSSGSSEITLPASADFSPLYVHLAKMENGQVVLTAAQPTMDEGPVHHVFVSGPNGSTPYNRVGVMAEQKVELFADDGTGVTSDGKLWRNGETIPLSTLCPEYKTLIDEHCEVLPIRANKYGHYLFRVRAPDNSLRAALMVPVEIVDKDRLAVDPQVGKMDEQGVIETNSNTSPAKYIVHPDLDPKRFKVRVRGGANIADAMTTRISTTGNPKQSYDDPPSAVFLNADSAPGDPKDFISKSQLLVSDVVDDTAESDNVANDEDLGDGTHKIQIGGNLTVPSVTIGATIYNVGLKVPCKEEKVINVGVVVVGSADASKLALWQDTASERFAQAGVRFTFSSPMKVAYPTTVTAPIEWGEQIVPEESRAIINTVTPTVRQKMDVIVYLVPVEIKDGLRGVSYPASFVNQANASFENTCFVAPSADIFTFAHEIGHLLTNKGHYGMQYPTPTPLGWAVNRNLMREGTSSNNTLDASKRLYTVQVDAIRAAPHHH